TDIDRRLADTLGCTKRDPSGGGFIFDDSDKPGIIYVPRTWKMENLRLNQTHCFHVAKANRFFVILENDEGLRIPEAEYEVTFADGTTCTGRLGVGGVAEFQDPPPGSVQIFYPDTDDVKAKSVAARARQACGTGDGELIHRVLSQSPTFVHRMAHA